MNDKPLTNHMGLPNEPGYNDAPQPEAPGREGGDDSLAASSPRDPNSDEKVLGPSRSERTEAPGDETRES